MRQKFHFDFVGNSKKFFILTLSLMLICLILNIFVFHTELDIQFTGGAIMKYSYSGDNLSENEISKVVQAATKEDVSFQYSKNMSAAATEENANTLSIELTEAKTIDPETEKGVTDALKRLFLITTSQEQKSHQLTLQRVQHSSGSVWLLLALPLSL